MKILGLLQKGVLVIRINQSLSVGGKNQLKCQLFKSLHFYPVWHIILVVPFFTLNFPHLLYWINIFIKYSALPDIFKVLDLSFPLELFTLYFFNFALPGAHPFWNELHPHIFWQQILWVLWRRKRRTRVSDWWIWISILIRPGCLLPFWEVQIQIPSYNLPQNLQIWQPGGVYRKEKYKGS